MSTENSSEEDKFKALSQDAVSSCFCVVDEETGHYESGAINWDEFWEVVKGNGPCNKDRVDTRRKAKEDGMWVVEAANAYAAKRAIRKSA